MQPLRTSSCALPQDRDSVAAGIHPVADQGVGVAPVSCMNDQVASRFEAGQCAAVRMGENNVCYIGGQPLGGDHGEFAEVGLEGGVEVSRGWKVLLCNGAHAR